MNTPWLESFLSFYYASLYFAVPLAILGVLYVRRPVHYRWARTSLALATLLGLLGFWLYPLAPPRLMPGLGYVDTVHGPQDFADPDYGALTAVSNRYAAMPPLHFGWSLWCAIVVVLLAPKAWMKLPGLLHPTVTVVAIVGTANHWILDAVGGAAVIGAGFALTRLLSGPRPRPPFGALLLPETDTPGADTSGTGALGTGTPGTDTPGTDTPGTGTPGTDGHPAGAPVLRDRAG